MLYIADVIAVSLAIACMCRMLYLHAVPVSYPRVTWAHAALLHAAMQITNWFCVIAELVTWLITLRVSGKSQCPTE